MPTSKEIKTIPVITDLGSSYRHLGKSRPEPEAKTPTSKWFYEPAPAPSPSSSGKVREQDPTKPLFVGRPFDGKRLWLRDIAPGEDIEPATEDEDMEDGLPDPTVNADDWRSRKYPEQDVDRYKDISAAEPWFRRQRGIYCSIKEEVCPYKHYKEALEKLPISKADPEGTLDSDLVTAIHWMFGPSTSDQMIEERYEKQYSHWKKINEVNNFEKDREEARLEKGLPGGKPPPRQVNHRLLGCMLSAVGAGGSNYVGRIRSGSRLVGIFDEPGVFPRKRGRNRKDIRKDINSKREMIAEQERIIADIKRMSIDAEEIKNIWETVQDDLDNGYMVGPFTPEELPIDGFLPLRIFTKDETKPGGPPKFRGCSNAKRSGMNRFTEVRTPIVLHDTE